MRSQVFPYVIAISALLTMFSVLFPAHSAELRDLAPIDPLVKRGAAKVLPIAPSRGPASDFRKTTTRVIRPDMGQGEQMAYLDTSVGHTFHAPFAGDRKVRVEMVSFCRDSHGGFFDSTQGGYWGCIDRRTNTGDFIDNAQTLFTGVGFVIR